MDGAIHEFWSLVSIKRTLQDDYEISKEKLKQLKLREEENKSFIIHILAEMGLSKEIIRKIDTYIDKHAFNCREVLAL